MYVRIARFEGGERNWDESPRTLARRFAAADKAVR